MKKSLFELYSLVVCIIAITIIISNFSSLVVDFMKFANVEKHYGGYHFEKFLNNTNYTGNWNEEKLKKFTDEKITELREQEYRALVENEKLDYKTTLVKSIIYLLSGIILFISHWIFAKRERMKK